MAATPNELGTLIANVGLPVALFITVAWFAWRRMVSVTDAYSEHLEKEIEFYRVNFSHAAATQQVSPVSPNSATATRQRLPDTPPVPGGLNGTGDKEKVRVQ